MLDLTSIADGFLDPIELVIRQLRREVPAIDPDRIMLVGAWCRDVLHVAGGHDFETSATRDIDLALALSDWDDYELMADAFPRVGHTGVAFRIAGMTVDLLPFGDVEDPRGIVTPASRGEQMSVWAFAEILMGSLMLEVGPELVIRCPTISGYVAAKLAAWLDRSEWGETKDANDLALSVYWYVESGGVEERLYGTSQGQRVFLAEHADLPLAGARLLGEDVAQLVGPERCAELHQRWPGRVDSLVAHFEMVAGPHWPSSRSRGGELVGALTRGLLSSM